MTLLWDRLLRPLAFRMDAEGAHEWGIRALASGLAAPFYTDEHDPILDCGRFGLAFKSPVGIAAGFDKNGVVVEPLACLGFGFVEVGTVTARPQHGNPKPRLFRLPGDEALINRLGFNNEGATAVATRLEHVRRSCVVGVNIGRNKDVSNDQAVANYLEAFQAVHAVADYIAVNVSSPNTPGLRELQLTDALNELLKALAVSNEEQGTKPIFLKIAPDLDTSALEAVCDLAVTHALSGIIATNTTTSREGLTTDSARIGDGGLSGAPLRERSTEVISTISKLTHGKLPIVGVGGIFSAEDAFEKIAAGACLVQAYTGFVYGGPTFPLTVNRGLAQILKGRGFSTVDEAVGSAVK